MRKPTVRSPSSSSSASTSSMSARESASRSSAKESPSLMRGRVDLQDVGEAVADELEHLLAAHGALLDMGLGGHDGLLGVAVQTAGSLPDCRLPACERPVGELVPGVQIRGRRRPGRATRRGRRGPRRAATRTAFTIARARRRAVADDAHAVDAEEHGPAGVVGVERRRRAASSAGHQLVGGGRGLVGAEAPRAWRRPAPACRPPGS